MLLWMWVMRAGGFWNKPNKLLMKILVVIPARFASTRFPGKMLAEVGGKSLILHAWENARKAKRVDRVLVATDDERILSVIEEAGGHAVMTDPELPSGTDRIAAALAHEPDADSFDYVINIQGDEPLFSADELDQFIAQLEQNGNIVPMATLARQMGPEENVTDPHVVKVVTDNDGFALYFSRSPIPYDRDAGGVGTGLLHHLGIYAYRPETLKKLVALPPGRHEMKEKLEQLRALENGIRIQVVLTKIRSIGVDMPEDVKRVESLLSMQAE
jgi:3-deoxy-manno-octulosonate cytidylyltransferase (CMP-KDO synthetase)